MEILIVQQPHCHWQFARDQSIIFLIVKWKLVILEFGDSYVGQECLGIILVSGSSNPFWWIYCIFELNLTIMWSFWLLLKCWLLGFIIWPMIYPTHYIYCSFKLLQYVYIVYILYCTFYTKLYHYNNVIILSQMSMFYV